MTRDADVLAHLKDEDELTREARAARTSILVKEYGPERYLMFPGGEISTRLFEEARRSFVDGEFVGCLLLSTTFIAVTLAGFYRMEGSDETADEGLGDLLRAAWDDGYITQGEFALINKVRRARNFYVHPPQLMSRRSVMHRVVREKASLDMLAERDARLALKAMLRLLRRRPFTLAEAQ